MRRDEFVGQEFVGSSDGVRKRKKKRTMKRKRRRSESGEREAVEEEETEEGGDGEEGAPSVVREASTNLGVTTRVVNRW